MWKRIARRVANIICTNKDFKDFKDLKEAHKEHNSGYAALE